MMRDKLFLIIFSISLPLLLLLFSYKTTLFFTDLTEEQDNTIQYLQNKEELQLNYTSEELSHLQDVKKVMRKADYVFYVLLLLATISLTHHKKNKEQLQKLFKYGGITTLSFVGVLFLISIISFTTSFTFFHQLFFPQGNWQFAADSLLIQTFPISFFIQAAFIIFIQTLFYGSMMIFLSKIVFLSKRTFLK